MGLEELFDRGFDDNPGTPNAKRYYGKYVGYARDAVDPESRGRVKFFCPEIMGDVDTEDSWLHWAEPCFPVGGGMNAGSFIPAPSRADMLDDGADLDVDADPEVAIAAASETDPRRDVCYWLEFRAGNPQYPIYVGVFYPAPEDYPNLTPKPARGVQDETTLPPTGTAEAAQSTISVDPEAGTCAVTTPDLDADPAPTTGVVKEPPPENEATTGKNRMYKSPSGHLVEFDDTPEAERIRVYHRTGSYMEFNPAGSLVTKVVGNVSSFTDFDVTQVIKGSKLEIVNGNSQLQVGGARRELYSGARDAVYQNFDRACYLVERFEKVVGRMTAQYGQWTVDCEGDVALTSGGSMSLAAMEDFAVYGLTGASMGATEGVRLHGALGPASATAMILDGTAFSASSASAAIGVTAAALTFGTAVSTLQPLTDPFEIAAFAWIAAVSTSLATFLNTTPAWTTIHFASKL